MGWGIPLFLFLVTPYCHAINESNDISQVQDYTNHDDNLRKALLKAISDLEKEDNDKYDINKDETINKNLHIVTPRSREEYNFKQKADYSVSESLRNNLNKIADSEQILISSSNSFISSNQKITSTPPREIQKKIVENSYNNENNIAKHVESTTVTTVSTEENEAKVEDVQFFSAPLVAAFTVHQDEQGVPKKVESIFKSVSPTAETTLQKDVKVRQDLRNQEVTQQIISQTEIEQRQRALEQEILRLNLSLKQQQEVNQQQERYFQQQALRLRNQNNVQPVNQFNTIKHNQFTTESINLNKLPFQELAKNEKEYNTKNTNNIKNVPFTSSNHITQQIPNTQRSNSFVSFTPSITFDPLVEAGKLPRNAQVLPVKNPGNFHAPIIQSTNFEQYHSVSQLRPQTSSIANNADSISPLNNVQRNRFLRQETGVGNEFNNDYSSSTQTLQSRPNTYHQERQTPSFFNNFNSISSVSYNPFQQVNNRFYRPSRESLFKYSFGTQQFNTPQLGNAIYRSQSLDGRQGFDVFPKGLTFNYLRDNQLGSSTKYERRVPFI